MHGLLTHKRNFRAEDLYTILDNLGVAAEQRLKCNAHVLLCVQNSVDKVFKDKETEIGAAMYSTAL